MVLDIGESGLVLESSAKAMAGLPTQSFAVSLSGSLIEDMIACVQNGGGIQLALGASPKFIFEDHDVRIPRSPDPSGYDLFLSGPEASSSASKLPNPTMSILRVPKQKAKPIRAQKATKLAGKGETTAKTAPARASTKPNIAASKPAAASNRDPGELDVLDDAIANLKSSLAKAEADKRENSALVVGSLPSSKRGKIQRGKRLLEPQAAASSPKSLPPSPAMSGVRSPSLAPSGNAVQEKAKRQRFPIIHELAVQELTSQELLAKWDDGSESEFDAALNKVADFDSNLEKWVLKKMYWKELDVFEYNYDQEEDRQKAINNAIRQYDRMRLAASDPLWQKLLPRSERGKGKCLSRLQAAIARGPQPTALKPRPDLAGAAGGDSEKYDSASSGTKKSPGGETMSRSSSQTSTGSKKLSPSGSQAKRLLSTSKKPAATAKAKTASKASPNKPAAKGASAKGGRVLSKEFVSDSGSDDEVPLSSSMPKSKAVVVPATKPAERAVDKNKAAEKPKEAPAPKSKPAAAANTLPKEKEKDTIRAQVIAKTKPIKAPSKRPRDADDGDDDSSSSGTPLSKRVKTQVKAAPPPVGSVKSRTASDTSQNSRGSSSGGTLLPRVKNASPLKSSPLALSPPTNASDMEQHRPTLPRPREGERNREWERERELDRDINGTSTGSNTDSSVGVSIGKKRPPTDSLAGNKAKRARLSPDILEKAAKFKRFYARYEELHHEIASLENPDPNKLSDLLEMRDRLSRMKSEIYASVDS